uniref:helix-hairpin-helix domain-containing protein n=1 Tax=Alistipes sp. TaxID=1872444 RepID=UPI004055D356
MEWFDHRERRGLLLFVPLALLLIVGLLLVERREEEQVARRLNHEERPLTKDSLSLFYFDPNTIGYDSLLMLGFEKSQALQLLKYRAAGKIYRLPEELALIYGMTDSLFVRIRPWVRIGEEFRFKPRHDSTFTYREYPAPKPRCFTPQGSFLVDTISESFVRSMGFSVRWSKAFVRVAKTRGIRSEEELRELNFVGDSIADLLAPWIHYSEPPVADLPALPVELNRADSATLCALYGIGPTTAEGIIRYRERLGGFHHVEQLCEVRGLLERNYEKILQQISCDSFLIQKIDINFAPAERLRVHPYLPPRLVRKIISKRQQRKSKGGWSTVEEMVQEKILTDEEAQRLRPYLRFGTQQEERNN